MNAGTPAWNAKVAPPRRKLGPATSAGSRPLRRASSLAALTKAACVMCWQPRPELKLKAASAGLAGHSASKRRNQATGSSRWPRRPAMQTVSRRSQ